MNIASTKRAPSVPTGAGAADLTVVGGAGHVGIPLVLALADAGLTVNVNDRNEAALAILSSGKLPFIEHGAAPLLARALEGRRLVFTSLPNGISRTGPVVITIGTPVDEFLNPVQAQIQPCIDSLLPHISDDQLLILRSTVYPGTTDWLQDYLTRRGRKNRVAFCPERVVQGYGVKELREMPQIVSATTPEAEQEASALFRQIAPELVTVRPIEAEFAKLFNNAYRYIEFAATNQFYMIAKSAGADYQAIMRAMKQNYPRAKNFPGPGFSAGPCLFKDTMQLADPALLPLDEVVDRSDILILCAPQSVYAQADLKGKPVIDVWGFLKNANVVY